MTKQQEQTMTTVTLKKAIELTGKSKRTIQRYMANGKLSYKTNKQGHKEVDVAELSRVFELVSPDDTPKMRPDDTPDLSPQIQALIDTVKAQQETIEKQGEQISELTQSVKSLVNRLEHKPEVVEPAEPVKSVNEPPEFMKSKPTGNYLDDIPTFGKG